MDNAITDETVNGTVVPFTVKTNPDPILPSIKITKASYLGTEMTSCTDVFSGFDEIRAVTFSYGLSFLSSLMHYFSYGEIIVGCEAMVKTDMETLINLQAVATNVKCHDSYLSKRVVDGELHLFVVREIVSHRKMYLLKADDGKRRVVFSSANGTMRAWDGTQDEHYIVFDSPEAYEEALSEFETLRDLSSDEILKNAAAIKEDCSNVDTLPICKTIKARETLVVAKKPDEDVEYTYVTKLSDNIRKALGDAVAAGNLRPVQKGGKLLFTADKLKKVEKDIKIRIEKKKQMTEKCPELIVDCEQKTAVYNGKEWDLSPSMDAVRAVAEQIIKYMQGFCDCVGDVDEMLPAYWKIMIYMFLAPVMGQLKRVWNELGNTDSRILVFYLLVTGPQDSGKTHFVEMVQTLMLGKAPERLSDDCFSSSTVKMKKGEPTITGLTCNVKGLPLFIDEMSADHWKYAGSIVKFDNVSSEEYPYRPCYIIVSNKVKSVLKEISKRVIVFHIDLKFPDDYGITNIQVQHMINSLGGDNPFYREYVRRMFLGIDDFIDEMRRKNEEDEIADVFRFGSSILTGMFRDLGLGVPDGLSEFDMFDFVGGKNRCKKALNLLRSEFMHNPGSFTADEQQNILVVDFSAYDSNDCKDRINLLVRELPVVLDCKNHGKCVKMNLAEAEREAGLSFRKKKKFGRFLPWKR